LSPKGGMDRISGTFVLDLGTFIGDRKKLHEDDTYGSLINTNPTHTLYFVFGLYSNTNFSSGIIQHIRITYSTIFTDLNYDIPHLNMEKRLRIRKKEEKKEIVTEQN
jgi:hypothetical protein